MTQAIEQAHSSGRDRAYTSRSVQEIETEALHRRLVEEYADLDEVALLRALTREEFPGRSAVIASFGTESAVLLDLVASVDRSTPVIFIDTGKHFAETLAYRDELVSRLGLTDVRNATPSTALIKRQDRDGTLWQSDPDACCHLRKVIPLQQAITPFGLIITGRKRAHGGLRAEIDPIELFGGRIRVNPLADWDEARIDAEFTVRDLPRHPLQASGYRSIGCAPCTDPVSAGASQRSGRWSNRAKTECGIHFDKNGTVRRDQAAA
ncbi:phosphoadenylyl-sulfate reductase [Nisaea acidiphila]|uniref:Adenosine 5'-phosphosulfate reductase n=1 Tax=Nisaea acidiphila TaxID=1862145 RepID=A0A9J7AX55_9PROT|nr:phosphoadenylyl-sulfate reductase [Nisaea acidiphila]UUX51009.1 phosphoadenylyl-sulfate reductase [Nisaea acidiphila]